jgi:tyrosyl-tRNA synthetase
LITDVPLDDLKKIKQQLDNGSVNPMNLKRRLAKEIIGIYHDTDAAASAEKHFDKLHKKKEIPDDIPEFQPQTDAEGKAWIVDLLTGSDLASSNSEARRLVKQGGVRIDGKKVNDFNLNVPINEEFVLQVGKRKFVRITP